MIVREMEFWGYDNNIESRNRDHLCGKEHVVTRLDWLSFMSTFLFILCRGGWLRFLRGIGPGLFEVLGRTIRRVYVISNFTWTKMLPLFISCCQGRVIL